MRIVVVTPAPRGSRKGNRISADRWGRILRALGHAVRVVSDYGPNAPRADLLVAVHAEKSAPAVHAFRKRCPGAPVVLVLGGTDVYAPDGLSATTLETLRAADAVVGLNDRVGEALPADVRGRLTVIRQSAEPPAGVRPPQARRFEVCVSGHLRAVKDPLRTAWAARLLPAASRLRVVHLGGALEAEYEALAAQEARENPRYTWLGELSHARALRRMARCRLLVLSSRSEGGAAVLGEAVVSGVPVLASAVAGNEGLLGPDHPGYFPYGDTEALAAHLHRAETEPAHYARLQEAMAALAPLFAPEREHAAWEGLVAGVTKERWAERG